MQTIAEKDNKLLDKVACNDLAVGMYVQELDRPWLGTPFLFQGFCIKTDGEIEILKQHCEHVYVNKSREEAGTRTYRTITPGNRSEDARFRTVSNKSSGTSRYLDTVPVEEELYTAKTVYRDSHNAVEQVFRDVHSDREFNLQESRKAASDIVDSVLRNPDAFMLLSRMKNKSRYRYSHAINCCAIAATFCRHLGFSKNEIHDISLGAMLIDIGMTKLPASLIETQGSLNALSMKLVRHHIDFGREMLEKTPDMPGAVRDMILTHHERVNGKGYPKGLKAEEIPISGRIAAIIDCYDAMISDRPHKEAISPTEAVCAMYNWRNVDFHEDLMEQFIQCIGTYPTGSLVELGTGQIGIIMSQNRVRRLYPKILLIMDEYRMPYDKPRMLDLSEYHDRTRDDDMEISKVLNADELGIECSDYYL